jgi:hypothetical protein
MKNPQISSFPPNDGFPVALTEGKREFGVTCGDVKSVDYDSVLGQSVDAFLIVCGNR